MEDLGESTTQTLQERKHTKIPIYIVDYHHDVVEFIHQNIKTKHLPSSGNVLVHFDAHPDLQIPFDMLADDAFQPDKLYDCQDIGSWIMPNVYTGIIDHVIWAKPPWANQIQKERIEMRVGKCPVTDKMRLDSKELYFIAECLYMIPEVLLEAKKMILDTITLSTNLDDFKGNVDRIEKISDESKERSIILDIDLDFFSVDNPFLDFYEDSRTYSRLREIFKFEPPISESDEDVMIAQDKREQQLKELKKIFYSLRDRKKFPKNKGPPSDIRTKCIRLVSIVLRYYKMGKIDWESFYDAGCTIDNTELPSHITNEEEQNILFKVFEMFLDTFKHQPTIITIARSSDDLYTPPDQVDEIQEQVLLILNKKFNCDIPIHQYLVEKPVKDETVKENPVKENQNKKKPLEEKSLLASQIFIKVEKTKRPLEPRVEPLDIEFFGPSTSKDTSYCIKKPRNGDVE